jgi:hypothetical protein
MGYIGLLLNAPYKIDSMVWMSLMRICLFLNLPLLLVLLTWLYEPRGKRGCEDLNRGDQGFRRF